MSNPDREFEGVYSYLEGQEFIGDEPDSTTQIAFKIPEPVARRLVLDLRNWLDDIDLNQNP